MWANFNQSLRENMAGGVEEKSDNTTRPKPATFRMVSGGSHGQMVVADQMDMTLASLKDKIMFLEPRKRNTKKRAQSTGDSLAQHGASKPHRSVSQVPMKATGDASKDSSLLDLNFFRTIQPTIIEDDDLATPTVPEPPCIMKKVLAPRSLNDPIKRRNTKAKPYSYRRTSKGIEVVEEPNDVPETNPQQASLPHHYSNQLHKSWSEMQTIGRPHTMWKTMPKKALLQQQATNSNQHTHLQLQQQQYQQQQQQQLQMQQQQMIDQTNQTKQQHTGNWFATQFSPQFSPQGAPNAAQGAPNAAQGTQFSAWPQNVQADKQQQLWQAQQLQHNTWQLQMQQQTSSPHRTAWSDLAKHQWPGVSYTEQQSSQWPGKPQPEVARGQPEVAWTPGMAWSEAPATANRSSMSMSNEDSQPRYQMASSSAQAEAAISGIKPKVKRDFRH